MADLKINQFPVLTNTQVNDNTLLMAMGVSTTGVLSSATVAQLKAIFSTQTFKYVTTGTEGSTLTIPTIAAMSIIAVYREGSVLYQVTASPNSAEFIWDTVNITLGTAVNPIGGERFLILYKQI